MSFRMNAECCCCCCCFLFISTWLAWLRLGFVIHSLERQLDRWMDEFFSSFFIPSVSYRLLSYFSLYYIYLFPSIFLATVTVVYLASRFTVYLLLIVLSEVPRCCTCYFHRSELLRQRGCARVAPFWWRPFFSLPSAGGHPTALPTRRRRWTIKGKRRTDQRGEDREKMCDGNQKKREWNKRRKEGEKKKERKEILKFMKATRTLATRTRVRLNC